MLNELRAEMSNVVMEIAGSQAVYTFKNGTTKPLSVRIYEDAMQFDEMGAVGTHSEVGIDVNDIDKCHESESFQTSDKKYVIHSFVRKVGNIKRYKVI